MILAEAPFAIARLRFVAQLEAPLEWPEFPGAMLRGAFGAALRRLSCMTGMRSCAGCPLLHSCPYPLLFEPPGRDLSAVGILRHQSGLPPPFALDVTDAALFSGAQLQFSMRLFGTAAIERLALVVEAWRRALAHGLGRQRTRGELLAVAEILPDGERLLWDGGELLPAAVHRPALTLRGSDLIIRTRTPLRLKMGGALLRTAGPEPARLVAAIVRRARLLAAQCDAGVQARVAGWPIDSWLQSAAAITGTQQLAWRALHRFSARQQRRMDMGGLVGEWHWQQVPPQVQALLALGCEIHVGKEACFGLGACTVHAAA